MTKLKYFTILATVCFATTTKAQQIDAKNIKAEVVTDVQKSTIPVPGAKIVAPTPPQTSVIAPADLAAPSPATNDKKLADGTKLQTQTLSLDDTKKQSNLTDEKKATLTGSKLARPKIIDQSTGLAESKLTPATPAAIKPVIAVPKEN